jgi:anti-anti-sigma regulatory factor
MFRIELDQGQSWLTIRYEGYVSPDEAHRCAEDLRVEITKIKPGFRLLVDLTDLQSMDVSCAPHIRDIMDMCNQNGVAGVVRIIPDPKRDIGLQIMSYFHYSGDVHIVTCDSLSDATNALAALESTAQSDRFLAGACQRIGLENPIKLAESEQR